MTQSNTPVVLAVGDAAPDFTLDSQRGESVSLSALRGKKRVVLYFYPKAMTPGCTMQARGIRDSASALDAVDAVVYGLSPDPVDKLARFAERDSLTFDLLSDPSHEIASAYGAWGEKKFMGRKYHGILRQTFFVDKAGRIEHVMYKVRTRSHHDDVLDWLRNHPQ